MSDLELLDGYIANSTPFISPKWFNAVKKRGLLWVVNKGLPVDVDEAKVVVRTRLASIGHYIEDEEIAQIASKIKRIEKLRVDLLKHSAGEVEATTPILKEMLELTNKIRNYYK